MAELERCKMCGGNETMIELHKTNKGHFCSCCIESGRPYHEYDNFMVTDQSSIYYIEEVPYSSSFS